MSSGFPAMLPGGITAGDSPFPALEADGKRGYS